MKGATRYIKILLVVFRGKKISWGNLIFLALRLFFTVWLWAWSNWARPLSIGSLNSQDMIRILNSEDMISQVNMWWIFYGYYVMFMCGGQNLCFCKALLRICFVSLFECKGPWMLKTIVICHVWNRGLQN